MGGLLRAFPGSGGVSCVTPRGASADGIRPLLSRIAYGDEDTARIAVDDLGDAICALGFVVGEGDGADGAVPS